MFSHTSHAPHEYTHQLQPQLQQLHVPNSPPPQERDNPPPSSTPAPHPTSYMLGHTSHAPHVHQRLLELHAPGGGVGGGHALGEGTDASYMFSHAHQLQQQVRVLSLLALLVLYLVQKYKY
jgi:hypothetical protein